MGFTRFKYVNSASYVNYLKIGFYEREYHRRSPLNFLFST
jgi:hypothetical protein